MGQHQHCHEQGSDDPGAALDLLAVAAENADDDVGDQAKGDAVGDIVGKGHDGQGQESGNGDLQIVPVDILHAAHHQEAHIDQGGSGGAAGDQLGNGTQEHGREEEQTAEHRGQTGASAGGYARVHLAEGGDGGGAAEGAHGGGDGVGEHALVHVEGLSLFVHQAGTLTGGVEGTQSVEHIHHAEGQRGGQNGQHKIGAAVLGGIGGEVKAVLQHRKQGQGGELTKSLEGADEGDVQIFIEAVHGQAKQIIKTHAAQNADQYSAPDVLVAHNDDGQKGAQGHHQRHDITPALGQQVEGGQIHAGRGVRHHNARILQTQQSNEQADAAGDRHADGVRQGVKYLFPQAGDGQQDENDAFHQDQHQGVGIGQAEAHADGVDEEGVQAHTAGLGQRQVGHDARQNGAHHSGNGGGDVDGAVRNAQGIGAVAKGIGEHIGVDHQNIDHGKEGGHTGDKFRPDCGTSFTELEKPFHRESPFSFCWLHYTMLFEKYHSFSS